MNISLRKGDGNTLLVEALFHTVLRLESCEMIEFLGVPLGLNFWRSRYLGSGFAGLGITLAFGLCYCSIDRGG